MVLTEKESKLLLPGVVGNLEAVLCNGVANATLSELQGLAIICHPHPQQGGSMDNKVVNTLMRTYRDLGIHALRFNFRGVGESDGVFDNAVGELDDALSVIQWAKAHRPDSPLLLAGFSFGSSIAARASYLVKNLAHLTLVAPPLERYDFDREGAFNSPVCVVQGDKDERVNAQAVYQWLESLHSGKELICYPEAGHFFHGYLTRLKTDLTTVLLRQIVI